MIRPESYHLDYAWIHGGPNRVLKEFLADSLASYLVVYCAM